MDIERQQSKPDPLAERKRLTFAQAEGVVPMPGQLQRGEISQEFRAVTWSVLKREFEDSKEDGYDRDYLGDPWLQILQDAHVFHHHELNGVPRDYRNALGSVRAIIENGSWSQVLGWLEFVLRHPSCPGSFATMINATMIHCRLAYRVFDGQVICPIGSDAERQTIERAFVDLTETEFHGARAHLRNAAERLTAGQFADSVRESIHAVESVARVLEPTADLSKALTELERSATIHGAMKKGFLALYGYTSDQQGVRHALLEAGAAAVDETDALFMIGACGAFVSYLINMARTAGLLATSKGSAPRG